TLSKITQIGAHIFYRWKGVYGETAAFGRTYVGHEPVIDEARFARPRLLQAAVTAGEADKALADAAAHGGTAMRTVEIDGRTRVVGVASLGGRRVGSREEIAA